MAIDAGALTVDVEETARLRALPRPEMFIDRGEPQDPPAPGEVRPLATPPDPWLVVSYRDAGLS